jgi:hypothetical protein
MMYEPTKRVLTWKGKPLIGAAEDKFITISRKNLPIITERVCIELKDGTESAKVLEQLVAEQEISKLPLNVPLVVEGKEEVLTRIETVEREGSKLYRCYVAIKESE